MVECTIQATASTTVIQYVSDDFGHTDKNGLPFRDIKRGVLQQVIDPNDGVKYTCLRINVYRYQIESSLL